LQLQAKDAAGSHAASEGEQQLRAAEARVKSLQAAMATQVFLCLTEDFFVFKIYKKSRPKKKTR
jgi:hypothetical protein